MVESVKNIIEWSEQTFPDATLAGQKAKFRDEICEYFDASEGSERLNELADLFIVALSICRFDMEDGLLYLRDAFTIFDGSRCCIGSLGRAIQEKMKTNRSRKWEKKDGQYQHVKE